MGIAELRLAHERAMAALLEVERSGQGPLWSVGPSMVRDSGSELRFTQKVPAGGRYVEVVVRARVSSVTRWFVELSPNTEESAGTFAAAAQMALVAVARGSFCRRCGCFFFSASRLAAHLTGTESRSCLGHYGFNAVAATAAGFIKFDEPSIIAQFKDDPFSVAFVQVKGLGRRSSSVDLFVRRPLDLWVSTYKSKASPGLAVVHAALAASPEFRAFLDIAFTNSGGTMDLADAAAIIRRAYQVVGIPEGLAEKIRLDKFL